MVASARSVLKEFFVGRGATLVETRQAIMSSDNDQPYLTTFYESGEIRLDSNTVIFNVLYDGEYSWHQPIAPELAQHGGANVFVRYASCNTCNYFKRIVKICIDFEFGNKNLGALARVTFRALS